MSNIDPEHLAQEWAMDITIRPIFGAQICLDTITKSYENLCLFKKVAGGSCD